MENTWKYYLLKSFCFALIQRVFIVSLLFLDIHAFFFVNATVYKFKDETFKISLYFDFFLNLLRADNETKSVKTIYNKE